MFSSWDEAWVNDPVKAMTKKIAEKPPIMKDKGSDKDSRTSIYDFSTIASPSINMSDTPFRRKISKRETNFSDIFDTPHEKTSCASATNHIRNCDECYAQFKKMIDRRVNEKLQDMMMFNNFNRQPTLPESSSSDSWKETLIIIAGVVLVIFMLYLMAKSLNK